MIGDHAVEVAMTLEYKHRYGVANVRGGYWTSVSYDHGKEVLDGYTPGSVYGLSEAYLVDFMAHRSLTE